MKHLMTLMLCLMLPLLTMASAWDSKYKEIEQAVKQPTFNDKTFVITKFGANTKYKAAINQRAINAAITACNKAGGGRVVVPAGIWNTGALTLKSNVNLVVEKGATLLFAFDPSLYPIVPTRWEGLDCWNLQPLIYAYKAKNIGITGEGTIDGNGSNETWWKWCGAPRFGWTEAQTVSQRNGSRARLQKMSEDGVNMNSRKFGVKDGLRPQLINLNMCENILIENVTLLRSPFWVIHPLLSKNITVRGVHIWNEGPNGDGCDPESCENVLIENCLFHTGDDCIAIKSGRNADGRVWNIPSKNMIVRGCKMEDGHGGLVIGSEISGGCNNVFVENCEMDSPNLERVLRLKTNSCRGGVIEDIYARNIKVGQCKEAVLKINLDYEHNEICCRGFNPIVRNVFVDNVTCEKSKYGVMIVALDTVTNVYNINVNNCKWNGVESGGNYMTGKTKDVNLNNLFINGSLVLDKKPYDNYSQWMTFSEMKRNAHPYLLDFSTKPKWSYVMGIEMESMLDTYLAYKNPEILNYLKEYTDTMIDAKGNIRTYDIKDYNLDQIRTGRYVLRMNQLFPEKKNMTAIKTLFSQLEKQPRTNEGVWWHKNIYANQVWLDGIYMGLPFYTLSASYLKKNTKKVYNDAVAQLMSTSVKTYDEKTGLWKHAWDETHSMFWANPETGLSQHTWGRAQGWMTMAMIEILDALPDDYARKGEVVDLLNRVLSSVIKYQDKKTGLWYQVMDVKNKDGNYLEATCSSMFAYALLKGYRMGYLKDKKFLDAGKKAYQGILDNFIKVNADSTISLTHCCAVAGLGPQKNPKRDGSFEYYISEPIRDNDAKGVGPFIWASLEMEKMNTK